MYVEKGGEAWWSETKTKPNLPIGLYIYDNDEVMMLHIYICMYIFTVTVIGSAFGMTCAVRVSPDAALRSARALANCHQTFLWVEILPIALPNDNRVTHTHTYTISLHQFILYIGANVCTYAKERIFPDSNFLTMKIFRIKWANMVNYSPLIHLLLLLLAKELVCLVAFSVDKEKRNFDYLTALRSSDFEPAASDGPRNLFSHTTWAKL